MVLTFYLIHVQYYRRGMYDLKNLFFEYETILGPTNISKTQSGSSIGVLIALPLAEEQRSYSRHCRFNKSI